MKKIDWATDRDLYNHLVISEGKILKPYTCSRGYTTIGIGRNLEMNGISDLEAELMCLNDIRHCQADLDNHLSWWRGLTPAAQFVLIDMCFNMGITKLRKFSRTLNLLKNGQYESASYEMLNSSWAGQVGGRAEKLSLMIRGK